MCDTGHPDYPTRRGGLTPREQAERDRDSRKHERDYNRRRGGWGGMGFLLVGLAMCDSGGNGGVRPSDDEVRAVVRRQGKSLRDYIDSHQRRNGDPQRFTLLAPLRELGRIGGIS